MGTIECETESTGQDVRGAASGEREWGESVEFTGHGQSRSNILKN